MKAAAIAPARSILGDFLELTKPRLTSFVLVVVYVSAMLASRGSASLWTVLAAVAGAGLVAAAASALNMHAERLLDARMFRTMGRPLPTGRLQPREVLLFGLGAGAAGLATLALCTTAAATLFAFATIASYLLLYTPLKRTTTLNTQVGAVSGALPALIGWTAVGGGITPSALALFAIVYLWQIPHFLAIAWIHRDDYRRGGYCMLTTIDEDGSVTARQAVVGCIGLIPVSLFPVVGGLAGAPYLVGALLLGGYFLSRALRFLRVRTEGTARALLRASLLYLPLLLLVMLLDARVW